MIVLDIETTGLDSKEDDILSLYIVNLDNNQKYYYEFNTNIQIKQEITEINSFTNEYLSDKPFFNEKAEEIFEILNNKILIGYNSSRFDIPFLTAVFKKHNFDLIVKEEIDIYTVWQNLEKSKKLTDCYFRFTNEKLENAHDAKNDVDATITVMQKMKSLYNLNDNDLIKLSVKKKKEENIKLFFGKYKYKTIYEVYEEDQKYLAWLCSQDNINKNLKENILKLIDKKLKNNYDS